MTGTNPDKLIVKGLSKSLDGEYDCDIVGMMTLDHPEALTNREGHKIKVMSGVPAGQIEGALRSGDNDVLVALASVVLARHGKAFDEEQLWDAPMGSGLDFDIADREEDEDASPPDSSTSSEDGGSSSSLSTSENQELDPSPTGTPDSATPISDQD